MHRSSQVFRFLSNYFNVYICGFICIMGIMIWRSQQWSTEPIIIPITAHNASETELEHFRWPTQCGNCDNPNRQETYTGSLRTPRRVPWPPCRTCSWAPGSRPGRAVAGRAGWLMSPLPRPDARSGCQNPLAGSSAWCSAGCAPSNVQCALNEWTDDGWWKKDRKLPA